MANVWVVGFAPDYRAINGTGGFDWYRTWDDAADGLINQLEAGAGFDLRLTMVDIGNRTGDDITEYLDENPELWDPPSPPSNYKHELSSP